MRGGLAEGPEEGRIELGYTRDLVIEDGCAVRDGTVSLAERTTAGAGGGAASLARRTRAPTSEDVAGCCRRGGRGRRPVMAERGDRRYCDEQAGDRSPANPDPTGR